VADGMNSAFVRLRLAIGHRKWLLWVMIAGVLVIAWFVAVSFLPHHVVNSLQHYEEQANGLHEYSNRAGEAR
jgi:hypothetical protein